MTDTARRPRRPRRSPASRPTVWLDAPPEYLRFVPRHLLAPDAFDPEALVDHLRRRGLAARPTLIEVEAERARRGMRGDALQAAPAPQHPREVLPMLPGVSNARLIREAAAANRARIVAALGEVA